jgi:predicted transcriptional regulator of viral defense system
MPSTKIDQVLKLLRRTGVLRPRDLSARGIPREYLIRMLKNGVLQRRARGIYTLTDAEAGEHQSLLEVCKRVPHGVVCLLSALQFHGLTTQAPFEVWLAIDAHARIPKIEHPPVRIVRFARKSLNTDVEERVIQGVTIRVTNPARTVVDCFKYRNKVSIDVAIEALRDCRRKKKATMDDLHRIAKARRMANVMRPYLESLT